MASGTQGNVMVGIYIPAFSYPAALSFQAIANAALDDFGLKEDVCEFFRTDSDSRIACIIKNTRFSLQAIEQTYKHNQSLADQLARAADALVAFQEKIEADELIIDNLKAQLLAMKSEENDEGVWKAKYEEESTLRQALQEKLEQLKHVVNSDTILEHTEHNNKPKIPIPRLQLSTMNGIPQLAMNGIGGGRGGEGRGEDTHIDSSKSAHEPKNVLSTTSPREQFRNGPVVTSPREQFRNGPSVTSPRDLHRGGSTRDTHPTTSREGLVSPRDAYAYAVAAAAAAGAPNGKRSSMEMALSMTSPRKHPNGIGSIPNGIVDASVRNTNSPRASVAAKAHSRRHSSNMDESVPMRRLSANSGELPMTPRASASPSPRSKSSGEIPPDYFDYGGHPFPIDVHSIMPVVHSFSYNAIDSPVASKRRSTISNLKSSRSEMDFTADVLSQCRLCNCDTFRVAGQADWICVCGHTSIKHSVNLLKASPSPSPTASPRKFG